MNNRTIILVLSAVLIAAALSGCVQEAPESGTPDAAPKSNITPDTDQLALASEVVTSCIQAPPSIANWKYVSYRNLSISNAPALNQTARVTYSIIPDTDIDDLLVYISFIDGFEFVDVEGERLLTWGDTMPVSDLERCARWRLTNISKDEMYQFSATIKAVKTGNWTIHAYRSKKEIYLSVSEDSAYISDEPFPYIPRFRSRAQFEKDLARQNITPIKSPNYNITLHTHPRDSIDSKKIRPPQDIYLRNFYWNGTEWVEGREPVMSNQS